MTGAGDGGQPVIRYERVRKEYPDGTVAVAELDLQVRRGELMVLVGPSGCGKSTTLRMANRLVEPTAGRILVEGRDIAEQDPVALRRRMGYVIQDVGLFPHRTVEQNVGTVPRLLGWPSQRIRARAAELLDLVGLDPAVVAGRYPHQLSGGERQRVGVARALAADPPVLLMDEPFGAVDPAGRRRLQQEFWRIQRELGTTVMFVTHDVDEAVRLGDRIAVLSRGGQLEQLSDAVDLLARPASPMVADLVGSGRAARLLAVGELTAADLAPGDAADVTPADAADLAPGEAAGRPLADADRVAELAGLAPVAALRIGTRLDDALAALAAAGGHPVPVLGPGGGRAGLLTADGLLAALRRTTALHHDSADEPAAVAEGPSS